MDFFVHLFLLYVWFHESTSWRFPDFEPFSTTVKCSSDIWLGSAVGTSMTSMSGSTTCAGTLNEIQGMGAIRLMSGTEVDMSIAILGVDVVADAVGCTGRDVACRLCRTAAMRGRGRVEVVVLVIEEVRGKIRVDVDVVDEVEGTGWDVVGLVCRAAAIGGRGSMEVDVSEVDVVEGRGRVEVDVSEVDVVEGRGRVEVDVRVVDVVEGRGRVEVDVREVDVVEGRGRVEVDVRVVDGVEGRGRVEVDVRVVDKVEGRGRVEVDVRVVDKVEGRGRVEVDVCVVDKVEGRGIDDDSVDAPLETCTNGSARSEVVKPCCGTTATAW